MFITCTQNCKKLPNNFVDSFTVFHSKTNSEVMNNFMRKLSYGFSTFSVALKTLFIASLFSFQRYSQS